MTMSVPLDRPKPEPSSEGGTSKSDTTTEEPKPEPEVAEGQPDIENSEEGSDTGSSSVETKSVAREGEFKPKTSQKKNKKKTKKTTKIVKKMGDKGRYDDANQMKTLGDASAFDTKSFLIIKHNCKIPRVFDNTKVQMHRYLIIICVFYIQEYDGCFNRFTIQMEC